MNNSCPIGQSYSILDGKNYMMRESKESSLPNQDIKSKPPQSLL
jgi:hypothetical protein